MLLEASSGLLHQSSPGRDVSTRRHGSPEGNKHCAARTHEDTSRCTAKREKRSHCGKRQGETVGRSPMMVFSLLEHLSLFCAANNTRRCIATLNIALQLHLAAVRLPQLLDRCGLALMLHGSPGGTRFWTKGAGERLWRKGAKRKQLNIKVTTDLYKRDEQSLSLPCFLFLEQGQRTWARERLYTK